MAGELIEQALLVLKRKRGAETLEWILIGGLVVGVGLVLYPGGLVPALTGTMGVIAGVINGAV